jgi:hypothetical protein
MARNYDWSPVGLGTDPIPGDPVVLRDEATKYKSVAESITEAATNLRNIANTGDASGEFVEAFATQANEVADRISKAEIKYTGLADALREYAGPLEQFQQDSVTILNRAINASSVAADGAKWEQHWTRELLEPNLTPADTERIQKQLDQAIQDRQEGESGASVARADLEQLGFDRDQAAHAAAQKIQQTGDECGINDSGWDNWVQFWEENDELIDNIMKYAAMVGAVLAVVAMFVPGLNVIVGGIILAITIASVLNAVAQVSAGTKPLAEGILDVALALVPLGLGKLAKGAVSTATSAAARTTTSSMASQGVRGWTNARALTTVNQELASVTPTLLQRFLSTEALELAKLQAIQKMALTVSGGAGNAGVVAQAQMWKLINITPVFEAAMWAVPEFIVNPAMGKNEVLDFSFESKMAW